MQYNIFYIDTHVSEKRRTQIRQLS